MIANTQRTCSLLTISASFVLLLTLLGPPAYAWTSPRQPKNARRQMPSTTMHATSRASSQDTFDSHPNEKSRRQVAAATFAAVSAPFITDVNVAWAEPAELSNVGKQAPLPEGVTGGQFITLSDGVQIKDFRGGADGSGVVQKGSTIQIQCTGRLLNLNGVIFYSTKENNPDGFGPVPLQVTLGKGEVLPGLESGLQGMTKGSIRRIIVPSELAYSKFPLLEPKPTTAENQRALDSVIKNPRRDATILFDVQVERILK